MRLLITREAAGPRWACLTTTHGGARRLRYGIRVRLLGWCVYLVRRPAIT